MQLDDIYKILRAMGIRSAILTMDTHQVVSLGFNEVHVDLNKLIEEDSPLARMSRQIESLMEEVNKQQKKQECVITVDSLNGVRQRKRYVSMELVPKLERKYIIRPEDIAKAVGFSAGRIRDLIKEMDLTVYKDGTKGAVDVREFLAKREVAEHDDVNYRNDLTGPGLKPLATKLRKIVERL